MTNTPKCKHCGSKNVEEYEDGLRCHNCNTFEEDDDGYEDE